MPTKKSTRYPYKSKAVPCPTAKDVERFNSCIDTTQGHGPHGDCWQWVRYRNPNGYGVFGLQGAVYLSHRVAFRIATGEDPGEAVVMHSCDNPSCCRPEHLSIGSQSHNARQSTGKSRNRGTAHWRADHTEEEIMQIRRERSTGATLKELAGRYHASVYNISQICLGLSWTHLPLIDYPQQMKRKPGDREEVFRLHELGWSNQTISKHFGVANSTICRVLKGQAWTNELPTEFNTSSR